MIKVFKHRLRFKTGEETERNSGISKENLLPTRWSSLNYYSNLLEYKLPLFQKRPWLTLLSQVWQTSHLEKENPEFPAFQG